MAWFILVLVAQLAWALENHLDNYLLSRCKDEEDEKKATAVGTLVLMSSLFQIVVVVVMLLLTHSLTHAGVVAEDALSLSAANRTIAIAIGVLEIAWIVPYLYALEHSSDESRTASLFQTVPVFGLLLGAVFFDEIPDTLHIVAGAIILLGSALLNTRFTREKTKLDIRTIGLMLLASSIIAFVAFIFKSTALEENFWGTAFWMAVGEFLTGVAIWFLVPSYRRQFKAYVARRDTVGFGLNAGNEVVDTIALLAFNGAVLIGPSTALVQATTAYQPVFILAISLFLAYLGSKVHKKQLIEIGLTQRLTAIAIIILGSIFIFI